MEMNRTRAKIWQVGTVVALGAALVLTPVAAAGGDAWRVGDLFVAVGDGAYHVFDRQGGFKQSLSDDDGGFTTDCSFSPDLNLLYTTNYTRTEVVVFDPDATYAHTIAARQTSPGGHSSSLVFDADGRFFVGHPDGNRLVHKYSDAGMLLAAYEVDSHKRGPVSLDLASDQGTLFYTSYDRTIRRYDTMSQTQLDDFATLAVEGEAAALRLLPPGDGTGGLLVADGYEIKRLDANGQVIQIYDAPDQDGWFALNLDPNGTSFWAADSETDQLFRFHVGSGRLEHRFQAGEGESIFGVCIRGELTAGVTQEWVTIPSSYALMANAPNPFNPSTQIEFQMPEAGAVSLVVYNLLGQQIRTLVSGTREPGAHSVAWDGRDETGHAVSSGVYLYRFESDGLQQTRRMLLLK